MKISYHLYVVKDSYGTIDFDVSTDSSNTIQICGMKDSDGKHIYFESGAYHLEQWCKENGLSYTDKNKTGSFI